LPLALEDLETYLKAASTLPPLVRVALIHYQFEAIHPFNDGNGRIGRLLITLLLCADSILPLPLLYLSAYLERHRQEYYQRLLGVSQRGEWHEWIGFFLEGVRSEASDAVQRESALLRLQREYQARAQAARASSFIFTMIDELFRNPGITVASTAKLLNVTTRAASQNVERLIKLGILQEGTGRKRDRVFIAPEVIKVLEKRGPHA
jgi:Fic family protein